MKIALFGYGYWGKKLFSLLQPHHTIKVVDPFARNQETEVPFSTAAEVFADQEISHCFISSPEETHFDLAFQALKAGKHVFVEKPLCLTRSQAEQLVQIAQRKKVLLFVDYTFLYDPNVLYLHSILQKGEIGQLKHITSTRYSVGVSKPYVSVFDDLAMHDIYLFRFFYDAEITELKAEGKAIKTQFVSNGQVTYATKSKKRNLAEKRTFSGYYSWIFPQARREMSFFGDKGVIEWKRTQAGDEIHHFEFDENEKLQLTLTEKGKDNKQSLPAAIEDFFQASQHFQTTVKTRYEQYVQDINVLESIRESHTTL
jgi:predicted dehydrogenase